MMDPTATCPNEDQPLPASVRFMVDVGLLVLLGVTAAAVLLRPDGWSRLALTLASASVVPGYCLCLRLPLRAFDALLGLSIALSLGVEAVLCLAMVWLHLWHPVSLGAGIAVVSGIVLVADLRAVRPQPRRLFVADEP
jgi:hypothetical protein